MPDARLPRVPSRRVLARTILALAASCSLIVPRPARGDSDTLHFEPVPSRREAAESPGEPAARDWADRSWLKVPFHEHLLTGRHEWPFHHRRVSGADLGLAYNRVDELRLGLTYQAQARAALAPRLATRFEYATGRQRWLYGVQLEQPLQPSNLLAAGVSMTRATDHLDLNQVEDFENSLALLLARQDYRDYFEREGLDAYVAARWPGVTTLSVHLRNDQYRSLDSRSGTRSLFHRQRPLRLNPPVAEEEALAVAVRLERHSRRAGGLYYWIEYESAGGRLGRDLEYRRLLADLRSVLRLAPATSVALRVVGGSAPSGKLPPQREFLLGGVDGLRAHAFGTFRGTQVALGQIEYSAGIGHGRGGRENVFHVIAFVDAGRAWSSSAGAWDVGRQRFGVDGGFGLATAEDHLRVYFAKNLRDPDADFVISARLSRPF